MSKIIVIPDIHGRIDKLNNLLNLIDIKYQDYKLVFLGDYIDRGSDSNKVLYKIKELTERGHIALMGNHEEFLLEWLHCGGQWYLSQPFCGNTTVESFSKEANLISKTDYKGLYNYFKHNGLLEWLSKLPSFYKNGNLVFSHAPVDQWNYGLPKSDKAAKHSFPKSKLKEDLNDAICAPDGCFAVCGHVTVEEPTICDYGMYLDCGCGNEGMPLKAAVFIDNNLIEILE